MHPLSLQLLCHMTVLETAYKKFHWPVFCTEALQFVSDSHMHAHKHTHTHSQTIIHRCRCEYCHLFRSSCEFSGLVSCVFHSGEKKKESGVSNTRLQLGLSHIVHTRTGSGPLHFSSDKGAVFTPDGLHDDTVISSCAVMHSQIILTTGKYL